MLYSIFVSGIGPDWSNLTSACSQNHGVSSTLLTRSKESRKARLYRQQCPSDAGYSGHNPNHPLLFECNLKGLLTTEGKQKQEFVVHDNVLTLRSTLTFLELEVNCYVLQRN